MEEIIEARDMYLRFGKGPAQCFRVWDAARFYEARTVDGMAANPPYNVTLVEREIYLKEKRATRR